MAESSIEYLITKELALYFDWYNVFTWIGLYGIHNRCIRQSRIHLSLFRNIDIPIAYPLVLATLYNKVQINVLMADTYTGFVFHHEI